MAYVFFLLFLTRFVETAQNQTETDSIASLADVLHKYDVNMRPPSKGPTKVEFWRTIMSLRPIPTQEHLYEIVLFWELIWEDRRLYRNASGEGTILKDNSIIWTPQMYILETSSPMKRSETCTYVFPNGTAVLRELVSATVFSKFTPKFRTIRQVSVQMTFLPYGYSPAEIDIIMVDDERFPFMSPVYSERHENQIQMELFFHTVQPGVFNLKFVFFDNASNFRRILPISSITLLSFLAILLPLKSNARNMSILLLNITMMTVVLHGGFNISDLMLIDIWTIVLAIFVMITFIESVVLAFIGDCDSKSQYEMLPGTKELKSQRELLRRIDNVFRALSLTFLVVFNVGFCIYWTFLNKKELGPPELDGTSTCASNNGIIATVHNDDKGYFLRNVLTKSSSYYFWICYEKSDDGFWRWEDDSSDAYTNWGEDEPSVAPVAKCAYVDITTPLLPWGAGNCQLGYPYVCQYAPCSVGYKNC